MDVPVSKYLNIFNANVKISYVIYVAISVVLTLVFQ